jgi:hypothetical protein
MNKIEFADINKFLSSIGIIFIAAAFFLPWFINQNSSLIVIEKSKIDSSSCTGKRIIQNQQEYLLFISEHLYFIAGCLIILGLFFLFVGIYRWRERQNVIDEKQDEELKAIKQQNISKEEKQELIENEIGAGSKDKRLSVQKYIDIENLIYNKFALFYTVNYSSLQNIRIGKHIYDIILKSKFPNKREDIILDIKYFERQVNEITLLGLISKFIMSINNYEGTQQRGATPIFIVIIHDDLDFEKYLEIKENLIKNTTIARPDLRIKFFKESEINSIDTPKLIEGE